VDGGVLADGGEPGAVGANRQREHLVWPERVRLGVAGEGGA
jgi:hypothetical protein